MRVVWYLACLFPTVISLCFQHIEAKEGRREILRNAKPVIDEYECRIDCAVRGDCEAFFYQEKERICWLLGKPLKNQTCAPPKLEHKRIEESCKNTAQPVSPFDLYKRNPLISDSVAFEKPRSYDYKSCLGSNKTVIDLYLPDGTHHVSSNEGESWVDWDKQLGSWYYKLDKNQPRTYIRGAACIEPPLSEPSCINTCPDLPAYSGLTDPVKPFLNVSPPCPKSHPYFWNYRANHLKGTSNNANIEFITCIYGSWFRLLSGGTREILSASCSSKNTLQ